MESEPFVIRPISTADLDWLYAISTKIGPGFTSIHPDYDYLTRRVTLAEKSVKGKINKEQRIFLFVRENLLTHELVGMCGIDVCIGYKENFYNYNISTIAQSCKELDLYLKHRTLTLVNDFQDASELISFWVHPDHRGKDIGKSLSLSRFLFIAHHASWFGADIVAEVRGVCDDQGVSPFWEAIGRYFFAMDFARADKLTMTMGKQFIADLVSREDIYVDLLPQAAQDVIGVEHPHSTGARHLLESEGFIFDNHIDIFDGGPVLHAKRDAIKTIVNSKLAVVTELLHEIADGVQAIIYNNKQDVRITAHKVMVLAKDRVAIHMDTAAILELVAGEKIRYCPI